MRLMLRRMSSSATRADPDGSARRSADAFVRRRTEFSLAVRDLANHVELL